MGHSFGGATTVTALADDKRFKYGGALHHITHSTLHYTTLHYTTHTLHYTTHCIIPYTTSYLTVICSMSLYRVGLALDAYMMPVEDGITDSVEQPLLFINTWTWQWAKNVTKIKPLVDISTKVDSKMITTAKQFYTLFFRLSHPPTNNTEVCCIVVWYKCHNRSMISYFMPLEYRICYL